MTPVTPKSLIEFAMRAVGVLGQGQSLGGQDVTDAFRALNGMIGQWNRKRWLIYHLIDREITLSGAESLTIGPGGDIDMPRAIGIAYARFYQTAQSVQTRVDMPLSVIASREDYDQIRLKNLSGWPRGVYLDAGYPMGTLNLWPVPQAGLFTLVLTLQAQLGPFSEPVQSISLPPEYEEALWTNLAIRLAGIYPGAVVTDDTRGLARASLQTIRTANLQVPERTPPFRRGFYDIRTGMNY